jgi:hypothetical protein
VNVIDDVELGAEGCEGGAVVEDEVEGRAEANVPEEGEVGGVGGADEADLWAGGELGEDGLEGGLA